MKKNIFTRAVEKRQVEKENQQDKPQPQANTPDIEAIKRNSKMAGAVQAWNASRLMSQIFSIEILEKVKEQRGFLDMGYASFGEYCEKECDIAKSTAYDWIKMKKNLGIDALKALASIGLNQKAIKALSAASQNEEIEVVDDKTPKLVYLETELEFTPENAPKIQQILDDIKSIKQQNDAIKAQLEETQKLLTNNEVLEICQRAEIGIMEFFKPLVDVKKRAQDPGSKKALIPTIIKIEAFVQEIKDELLKDME